MGHTVAPATSWIFFQQSRSVKVGFRMTFSTSLNGLMLRMTSGAAKARMYCTALLKFVISVLVTTGAGLPSYVFRIDNLTCLMGWVAG